jgi:protein-S-isoprenylcysteine O-methyltransferase Ste14
MPLRQRHFIDSHKLATGLATLGLMAAYDAWDNTTAWLYLGLHGGYGVLWALKSRTFPDAQWEAPCGVPWGLTIWGALSLYWVSPWLITSRDLTAPPWLVGLATLTFTLGVFLHFASDMQKHMHLQARPGTLLNDGLWARLRNPNYLGELLIYAGFSSLPMHPAPFVALGIMVAVVWVPNMMKKDRSLSRYPEFAEWRARSALWIPYLW